MPTSVYLIGVYPVPAQRRCRVRAPERAGPVPSSPGPFRQEELEVEEGSWRGGAERPPELGGPASGCQLYRTWLVLSQGWEWAASPAMPRSLQHGSGQRAVGSVCWQGLGWATGLLAVPRVVCCGCLTPLPRMEPSPLHHCPPLKPALTHG